MLQMTLSLISRSDFQNRVYDPTGGQKFKLTVWQVSVSSVNMKFLNIKNYVQQYEKY